MGADAPSLGLRYLGSIGRLFSISCRCEAKIRRSVSFVADGDVGFEAGLVAEHLVVVGLVGADGDVEGRVEIHPGDIAGVVVVGEERVGAEGQVLLERGVVGERGGFAQQGGGLLQIGGIRLAVRERRELACRVAADDGEKALGLLRWSLEASSPRSRTPPCVMSSG